jgi:hypothetical protein
MAEERDTYRDKEAKKRQDTFLAVYSKGASLRSAAKAAGTTRWSVKRWVDGDKYGFRERFESAQADFKDSLIERAMTRLEEQKASDSPLLLITMLNAYIPEKFRPNTIATEEVAKETIKELRQLSKQAFNAVPVEKEEQMTSKSPLQQVEDIILKKKGGDGD